MCAMHSRSSFLPVTLTARAMTTTRPKASSRDISCTVHDDGSGGSEGWMDEPDIPRPAAWRPVVCGCVVRDVTGKVVKAEGIVSPELRRRASKQLSPPIAKQLPLAPQAVKTPLAVDVPTGGRTTASPGRDHSRSALRSSSSSRSVSGRSTGSDNRNGSAPGASVGSSSLLDAPPNSFVVQLHPGTNRHKFEFLR